MLDGMSEAQGLQPRERWGLKRRRVDAALFPEHKGYCRVAEYVGESSLEVEIWVVVRNDDE